MANSYPRGTLVKVSATITDQVTGALVDPTTVTCTAKSPSGTTSSPVVTRVSVGLYTAAINGVSDGWWYYRFLGSGGYTVANEAPFFVGLSAF